MTIFCFVKMELFCPVYSNKNVKAEFDQNLITSHWSSNPEKLRTLKAKPNFTGSYKKKSVYQLLKTSLTY